MAKPVKDAKLKAQTIWPGATVVERGKGSIKHQHPTNPNRFMLDTQVGGRGWHFGDGPFTEANEVDTAWVDADPVLDAPWRKKMVLADYNAYAFREATLGFDQGQLIEYRHPASGEGVTFQPTQLQWTNDLGQLSPIEDPQSVSASIVDDTLRWIGAYGPGIDFQWEAQTARLMKYVNINSLVELGAPPQFIIDGGNPVLRIELLFQKSAGLEIWVDGALWNEKSNNPQTTLNNVEFRADGVPVWWFKAPKAWDSDPSDNATDFNLTMRLRKSGPNLFVEILTPWSWLETAVYPVTVDVIVDYQVGAGSDDGFETASGGAMDITSNFVKNGRFYIGGHRWTGVIISDGVTIDTAYMSFYLYDTGRDSPDTVISFEDSSTPATFTTNASDISNRTGTTATVNWQAVDVAAGGVGFYDSPELKTIIQELEDSYDYSGGLAMASITGIIGTSTDLYDRSYDQDPANAAKLHIEYTAAGGVDITVPVATLEITGYAPIVTATGNIDIEVPAASLVLTGYAPAIGVGVPVDVPLGTLVLTGFAPTVTTTSNIVIEIPVGVLVLTGYAPTVVGVTPDRFGLDKPKEKPYEYQRDILDMEPIARPLSQTFALRQEQKSIRDANAVAEALVRQNDQAAAERVSAMLAREKVDKDKADRRRASSLHNLAKAQIAKEAKAAQKAERDKVNRKSLQKARAAKKRKAKKK